MKITDHAVEKINEHLAGNPGRMLRIQAVPGGCAGMMYNMGLDDPAEDFVEIKGLKILMDDETKELMVEATIDYDDKEEGFKIDNPASSCGSCPGCH